MPGTPTESPLQRASFMTSGLPFSKNESACIVAGAASRPSIVVILPSGVRISMNPPPPMPHENGSTTPSTAAALTAASTALPPWRNASTAALVATESMLAAAPPVPDAVGCGTCWNGPPAGGTGGWWRPGGQGLPAATVAGPRTAPSPATASSARTRERMIALHRRLLGKPTPVDASRAPAPGAEGDRSSGAADARQRLVLGALAR